jgi:hypothetical protein
MGLMCRTLLLQLKERSQEKTLKEILIKFIGTSILSCKILFLKAYAK